MCLPAAPNEGHKCLAECRVCWILTVEVVTRLAGGEKPELGKLADFIGMAKAGCQLTAYIVQQLLNSGQGSARKTIRLLSCS